MAFIKDDINVKIFVLVVLVVVAMVSLLIVFNKSFKDINDRYQNKTQELNTTFGQLVGAKTELNKTMNNLELQNIKEEDLKTKYTQMKALKEALAIDKANLQADVANKTTQIGDLEFQLDTKTKEISSLKSQISRLNDKIDCLENAGTNC